MYLGEDPTTATPETPAVEPWYARPTEAILSFLGNITYQTDDYTIRSSDGTLLIDRRIETTPAPVTPAAATGTVLKTLARVPVAVWIVGGGLVLFSLTRK